MGLLTTQEVVLNFETVNIFPANSEVNFRENFKCYSRIVWGFSQNFRVLFYNISEF